MGYYGFKPYVSVAKRREKALREMNKLKKKGNNIQPIVIETRKITQTFWGNAWCHHIESFSDYENRLSRGRTYVRNGSVCHLAIREGCIEAMVSGSSIYKVKIDIKPLASSTWKRVKAVCAGKIETLLELLNGKLSNGIMQVVCDKNAGLFPLSNEIKLSCSCPDWADMCKHVAAVLYGVGARLDASPKELFMLRGVDYNELISAPDILVETTQEESSRRRKLDHTAIVDLFGIDMPNGEEIVQNTKAPKPVVVDNPTLSIGNSKKQVRIKIPLRLTGVGLKKIRRRLGLTQATLAADMGVSASTICKWEREGASKLALKESVREKLFALALKA